MHMLSIKDNKYLIIAKKRENYLYKCINILADLKGL